MDGKKYNIVSWNINGYNSQIHEWLKNLIFTDKPDIIFLNETKKPKDFLDKFFEEFDEYYTIINPHNPSRYHGVAMLVHKSHTYTELSIKMDIPTRQDNKSNDPAMGRIITILINNKFIIVGTYVPNSGIVYKPEKMDYRINKWDYALYEHLNICKSLYPTIWIGDINVALTDLDVSHPTEMKYRAGFTEQERISLASFLCNNEWIDAWRHQHPNIKQYSWLGSYDKREKDYGMRLDNIIISKNLLSSIIKTFMIHDCKYSDHIPICAHMNI